MARRIPLNRSRSARAQLAKERALRSADIIWERLMGLPKKTRFPPGRRAAKESTELANAGMEPAQQLREKNICYSERRAEGQSLRYRKRNPQSTACGNGREYGHARLEYGKKWLKFGKKRSGGNRPDDLIAVSLAGV